MAMNFTYYDVQLVKEKAFRYNYERKISTPGALVEFVQGLGIQYKAEEEFHMLTLDTKNNVTGGFTVSKGTVNASIVHPREVFKRALLHNASSIALVHNHPSGNPKPSEEDKQITKRLAEVGALIGIKVIDHIVLGEERYYSFRECGLI